MYFPDVNIFEEKKIILSLHCNIKFIQFRRNFCNSTALRQNRGRKSKIRLYIFNMKIQLTKSSNFFAVSGRKETRVTPQVGTQINSLMEFINI